MKTLRVVLWTMSVVIMLAGCTATTSLYMTPINIYEAGKIASIDTEKIEKLPLKAVIVVDENKMYTNMEWAKGIFDDHLKLHYPVGKLLKTSAVAYMGQLFDVEKVTDKLPYDGAYDIMIFLEVRKMRTERVSDYGVSDYGAVTADISYKLLDRDFSWLSPSIEIAARGRSGKSSFFTSRDNVYGLAAANAIDEGIKGIVLHLHKSLKHPEDFLSLARKVVAANPAHVEGYLLLGNVSNKYGHYNDALSASKRAVELQPNNEAAYRNMGHAYAAMEKYNDAIAAYKKAIELDPKNISNYFLLSNCYVAKEDVASAIAINEKAQELAPDNPDIPFALGSHYIFIGNFNEAISSLNKAISLRTMTGIGMEFAIEDNFPVVKGLMEGPAKRAGMEAGDKIIKINGQSTKQLDKNKVSQAVRGAEGNQVVLTIERKNLDNPVEKTVTRETIIEKSAAPIFGLRSLAYRMRGKTEDAEKDAEKAYSLDPNNDHAKEALGSIYLDKGKYDDAIKILSNTSKENYFARILEATAYAKTSGYKKAVEIYTSIPEDYLASKSALRQSYKKTLLESLKPYFNAKKDAAKSLEAKGQYREALNEYAEVLKVTGDKDAKEIRTHIAAILKEKPYLSQIPEEARKYALRGEAMLKDGKFEEALKEYKTAIKNAPYAAVIYRATALVYGELKDYAQAINHMNTYLDLMPDAPDARAVKDQIYKWEFIMEREKGEK